MLVLRHFDRQVFAGEDEIRPAAAFHEFRGGLRERGDDDWQSDGRVAVDVSSQRPAPELAVNQRFIKRDGTRTATGMRRVSGDLNRVLVTVDLLFENVRRHFSLTDEALGDAAAQIDYARGARADGNLRQIQNILHDVELKVVLLFKASACDAYGDSAVSYSRTENRHARFVSRGQHAVFSGDLCEFAAQQVQKLAR